jgi:hypothetical protein
MSNSWNRLDEPCCEIFCVEAAFLFLVLKISAKIICLVFVEIDWGKDELFIPILVGEAALRSLWVMNRETCFTIRNSSCESPGSVSSEPTVPCVTAVLCGLVLHTFPTSGTPPTVRLGKSANLP